MRFHAKIDSNIFEEDVKVYKYCVIFAGWRVEKSGIMMKVYISQTENVRKMADSDSFAGDG
jgi:hypothetical protein